MTTNDLIRLLIDKGIKLIPQSGGALDVDSPAGTLTPELIDALRQHKATILRRMRTVERREAEPVCRRLDRLICDDDEAWPKELDDLGESAHNKKGNLP